MLQFVLVSFGLFGVWESALVISPWTPPPWLQPVVVFGIALALSWPDWRVALAATGAVGLLHTMLRDPGPEPVAVRRSRIPRLPS
jgi:hypothetical protein